MRQVSRIFIMTAAFVEAGIELCRRYLEGVCLRQVREKVPDRECISLTVLQGLRW